MFITFGFYKKWLGFKIMSCYRAWAINLGYMDIVITKDSLLSIGANWKDIAIMYAPDEETKYELNDLISLEQISRHKKYLNKISMWKHKSCLNCGLMKICWGIPLCSKKENYCGKWIPKITEE